MSNPNFAEKATKFAGLAAQVEFEYSDACRTQWSTLSDLQDPLLQASEAAKLLDANQDKHAGGPLNSLFERLVLEIQAIELAVAEMDIERLKTDAIYAGGLKTHSKAVSQTGEGVRALRKALESLMQALDKCADAKTARESLRSPSRPKRKYAIVKEDYTDNDGGGPVRFFKGQHCEVDGVYKDGIRVASGSYSVFMTNDKVERVFDLVER